MQRVAVRERRALRGTRYHLLITFQWKEHLVTQEPGKTKMGGKKKTNPHAASCLRFLLIFSLVMEKALCVWNRLRHLVP